MTNNIRHLRKQRGWSIRDLAEKMSVSQPVHFTTIGKLERTAQKLSTEWIDRFAEIFGVPHEEIVNDSQPVLARRLPIVHLENAWDWEESAQGSEDYINAPGYDRATFAVSITDDQFEEFGRAAAIVFVESKISGLLDHRSYLVHGSDRRSFCASFEPDPPRFVPFKETAERQSLVIGRDEVKVLGRLFGMFIEL